MSGFANQVIGGISKLVRQAIQSPNFVHGVSGWSINKDGTAEFQGVTVTGGTVILAGSGAVLIYSGAPALGNLIVALSPVNGADSFGNAYLKGLSFPAGPTALANSSLSFPDPNSANNLSVGALVLQATSATRRFMTLFGPQPNGGGSLPSINVGYSTLAQSFAQIIADTIFFNLGSGNLGFNGAAGWSFLWGTTGPPIEFGGFASDYEFDGLGGASADVFNIGQQHSLSTKFNAGVAGKYCSGNWTYSTSRATGVLTALASLTQARLNSDYGTPIAAGVFTPPVDGYYDLSLFMNTASGATREACIITKNATEIAHSEAPNPTNLQATLVGEYLLTTDTIGFEPFYTSATTPQTLTGRVNIARRL